MVQCILISPHNAAICQTLLAYPPLDPNSTHRWLVADKLQPWQPAVWQILCRKMWRRRMDWPVGVSYGHTHTHSVGTSEVCRQIEKKVSMFQLFPMSSNRHGYFFSIPNPCSQIFWASSAAVSVDVWSPFCQKLWMQVQSCGVNAQGHVWLCLHVHHESLPELSVIGSSGRRILTPQWSESTKTGVVTCWSSARKHENFQCNYQLSSLLPGWLAELQE